MKTFLTTVGIILAVTMTVILIDTVMHFINNTPNHLPAF